jgi:ABC-type transport system involved in multi-copper enzyme maturation permease subunit
MEPQQILTIASKEFSDRLRNRWVLAVALVFTVFSVVIAGFGGAQHGLGGAGRDNRVAVEVAQTLARDGGEEFIDISAGMSARDLFGGGWRRVFAN